MSETCHKSESHDDTHRYGWVVDVSGHDAYAIKECAWCGDVAMTAADQETYERIDEKTRRNPDKQTYYERKDSVCQNNDGAHSVVHKMAHDDEDIAVRAVCESCDHVVAEWTERDAAKDAVGAIDIDECPGCGYVAWTNQAGGKCINDDVWHDRCWYRDQYGFEAPDEELPRSGNGPGRYDMTRKVETDIAGETFEWDEYIDTGLHWDHGRHNLPTRDELRPEQLEQLREWAVGENPTGDDGVVTQPPGGDGQVHLDRSIGRFPAKFVLLGGYESDAPTKWICPGCGEVVQPHVAEREVNLNAECNNCGSDKWLTAGQPIEESTHDAFEPLSDRERQVAHLSMLGRHTDKDMADALGLKPSSVREYRERAKSKARSGKRLYDKLTAFGVMDELEN